MNDSGTSGKSFDKEKNTNNKSNSKLQQSLQMIEDIDIEIVHP